MAIGGAARQSASTFLHYDILKSYARMYHFTGYATDVSNMNDRWGLVKGFVEAINDHRVTFVRPSDCICVDKSISRRYGLRES